MLPLRFLAIACLCACAGPHVPPAGIPRPDVPLVVQWPAGTRFTSRLSKLVPDEPKWRAVAVQWREALRQSVAFELHEGEDEALPALELHVDAIAGTWTASLFVQGKERILAGDRRAGTGNQDVADAVDRLAFAARLALGEPAPAPLPIARGTSLDANVLLAVADASELLRLGGFQAATRLLTEARRRDGGSPFVLEGLAALALLRNDAAAAERLAREALAYEGRLLPTVQHRLARTLLLARASLAAADAASFDQELLRLAATAQRERPHDPQPVLTQAIAHNFRGEFAAARPLLTDLQRRLPDQPIAGYHLGWACLGAGDAKAALPPFADAAVRLPIGWTLLPRAIALHEAGAHQELCDLLQQLRNDDAQEVVGLRLDVLRMQAAHALLRADVALARDHLLATLQWLAKHPLQLAQRGGELAEQGLLLVRLGGGDALPPLLAAIQEQHAGTAVADVCTFLQGLHSVHQDGRRRTDLETRLGPAGETPFAALLQAYAHERNGEIADMQQTLLRAAQLSSSPLTKALLARGLRAAGRGAEADTLLSTLRTEMRTLALRQRCRHPLLGPELAFVFVEH